VALFIISRLFCLSHQKTLPGQTIFVKNASTRHKKAKSCAESGRFTVLVAVLDWRKKTPTFYTFHAFIQVYQRFYSKNACTRIQKGQQSVSTFYIRETWLLLRLNFLSIKKALTFFVFLNMCTCVFRVKTLINLDKRMKSVKSGRFLPSIENRN